MNDEIKQLKSEMGDLHALLIVFQERHQDNVERLFCLGEIHKFQTWSMIGSVGFLLSSVCSVIAWQNNPQSVLLMLSTLMCSLSAVVSVVSMFLFCDRRWFKKLCVTPKLLFSQWKYEDVERAIKEKNFSHPVLQKLYKNAPSLRELSQEEIEQHHVFFSKQNKKSSAYVCWMFCLDRSAGHPIRQMDVDALYLLSEKESQYVELTMKEKEKEKEKADDQFEGRKKLMETVNVDQIEVSSPEVEVSETLSPSLLKDQYKNI